MKLTIMGSGTVVPDGNRNSSGYFLESEGVRMMIDCGAGTLHALARYGVPWQSMTHLFVSHFHVDHAGEMASLFFAFRHALKEKREEELVVAGPRGLDQVMRGLEEAFGANLFEPKFPVTLRMLSPGERMRIARDTYLSVAKTPHTEESLALRVDAPSGSLCYTGDTAYSEEVADFFNGASLIISECSFRERREGVPHVSIEDVALMAARAGAARLVVTHFYFDVDEEEVRRELKKNYPGEVTIGSDGLSIEI